MNHNFLRVAKPDSSGHCAQVLFTGGALSDGETHRNTLTYAMAIVGNERLLAERLGVKLQQVLNWTMGIEPVPTAIFLRAVDVVIAAQKDDIRRSRDKLMELKSTGARPKRKPGTSGAEQH